MSEISHIKTEMAEVGRQARAAARVVAAASTELKNRALLAIADALESARTTLAAENQKDLDAGRARGLDDAILDRLELKPSNIDELIEGLSQIRRATGGVDECDGLS